MIAQVETADDVILILPGKANIRAFRRFDKSRPESSFTKRPNTSAMGTSIMIALGHYVTDSGNRTFGSTAGESRKASSKISIRRSRPDAPAPPLDALLITLEKDDKDFSPQTRYKDYAMSPERFHWESQNQTSEASPTGLRYQEHTERGTHVLLFVRRYKKTDIGGPQPWMLLGPAEYESHEGSKPMGIVWRLKHELPADVWTYSALAAG